MDVERVRQKFDAAKSKHNIDFEAKEEQLKIAMTVMGGRNVLGLLPTGYVMYVHPYHAVGGGVDNSCYLAINIANR